MTRIPFSRRIPFVARIGVAALLPLAAAGAWTSTHAATPRVPSDPGVTSNSILFGQSVPQSGSAAQYGQSTAGIQAYFDAINAHGGVKGHKLQLKMYDDQYLPAVARQNTVKLVDQDHVFATVGMNGSAAIKADLTVLEPAGVPLISPHSGATYLQSPFVKTVYLSWPAYKSEGELLAKYAMNSLHAKKMGIIYQNDDYGKSLRSGVIAEGVSPAADISYDLSQDDFSAQAEQMKTKGVDAVFVLASPGKAVSFLNAMANINYHPQKLMSQASALPTFYSSSPKEFPGSYIASFIPPLLSNSSNAQVKAFLSDMSKYQSGKPASIFAAWGYMDAQIAVAGLQHIDGSVTRSAYMKALDGLKNLQTIGGSISYSSTNHHGLQNTSIVKAGPTAFQPVG